MKTQETNLTTRTPNGATACAATPAQGTALQTRPETYYQPRADIWETPDEYLIELDVPGVRSDQVELNFNQGVLTLDAHVPARQPENVEWLRCEYGIGSFRRNFRVGDEIDANAIHAEMANGVLTVHLPRAQQARARRIPLK
jgi:HSP20 family molecular chaperone IbpA